MANTYSSVYLHIIFATKQRQPFIGENIQKRLYGYLISVAKSNKMELIAVGGIADHIHLLILCPLTITISKGVQLLKGNSSKWMNDQFFPDRRFRWQKGYSAFSVSKSNVQGVTKYIQNQKMHHQERSFDEEYLRILELHQIEHDSRYVLG